MKIISGGQTGVDRAALDVALTLGLDCGGWCAKDRHAEDGPIPEKYPLWETKSELFHVRAQRNVESSSATLVLARGFPTGAARFTVEMAQSMCRPVLVIDLFRGDDDAIEQACAWLREIRPRSLNVAGPQESSAPGISEQASRVLAQAFRRAGYAEEPSPTWNRNAEPRRPSTPVDRAPDEHAEAR